MNMAISSFQYKGPIRADLKTHTRILLVKGRALLINAQERREESLSLSQHLIGLLVKVAKMEKCAKSLANHRPFIGE